MRENINCNTSLTNSLKRSRPMSPLEFKKIPGLLPLSKQLPYPIFLVSYSIFEYEDDSNYKKLNQAVLNKLEEFSYLKFDRTQWYLYTNNSCEQIQNSLIEAFNKKNKKVKDETAFITICVHQVYDLCQHNLGFIEDWLDGLKSISK